MLSVLNMKAVVAAFNQEKALVGAFSVIMNVRMELFEALLTLLNLSVWVTTCHWWWWGPGGGPPVTRQSLVPSSMNISP